MRALKEKIQSQSGASITFALLLFLVCSIVSSIVIVAGTAAGGRMKQLAETDQRYYAVMSAVELLKNEMVKSTPAEVHYTIDNSTGIASVSSSTPFSIRTDASEKMVQRFLGESPVETSPTSNPPAPSGTTNLTLNVTFSGQAQPQPELSCQIAGALDPNDNSLFIFVIESNQSSDDKKYSVSVKFRGRISEAAESTEDAPIKEVTWELHDMEKLPLTLNDTN